VDGRFFLAWEGVSSLLRPEWATGDVFSVKLPLQVGDAGSQGWQWVRKGMGQKITQAYVNGKISYSSSRAGTHGII
jgi:hypothetical protein